MEYVTRHQPITQSQLASLASKANAKLLPLLPTGTSPFTFSLNEGSSSAAWKTEYDRIRYGLFYVWYQNISSPYTQSDYSQYLGGMMRLPNMPAFQRGHMPAVSGPWIVSTNQTLVDGAAGWKYDDVELYHTHFPSDTQYLVSIAGYDGNQTMGNVYSLTSSLYVGPKTRVEFRVGGDRNLTMSLDDGVGYGGFNFTIYQSGSVSSSNVPNVTIDTNIPSYSITTSYASYGGGYRVGVPTQIVNPGLYYIELTTAETGWEWWNGGRCNFGTPGKYNTFIVYHSESVSTQVPAINNHGDATTYKIVAPHISSSISGSVTQSSWPFGLYTEWGSAIPDYGWYFLDVVSGSYFKTNPNPATTDISKFVPAPKKWTASPYRTTTSPIKINNIWVAKTRPILGAGIKFLDTYIPPTSLGGTPYSTMQKSASFIWNNESTKSINPAISYGVAQYPCLTERSGSGGIWSASYGVCVQSVVATRQPKDNGSGIYLSNYSGSPSESIYLTYYSGSTEKPLTTITIPAGSGSITQEVFWPVFDKDIPLKVSSSLTGSKPHVQCFPTYTPGYIGGATVVSASWFPMQACHYNDVMNCLDLML